VIVVANLYGQSADMDALGELADSYGVPILEDAAESLGAKYKGRMSGSFGRVGVFSFNGNKIITTSGGGALCSDDPDIVKRARFLATQAREAEVHYEHQVIGFNYRLSNVLAAIGRGQLRVIQERIARRRAIFDMYRTMLGDLQEIGWMPEPTGYFSTRWLTAMTIDRDSPAEAKRVIEGLRANGIEARPLWKPMHCQPVFRGCEYYPHTDTSSVSDDLFSQGLCLPSGSNLPDSAIVRVAEQVRLQLVT
jgi:dTDP-4-amino-4,6-dideoxygalactose transaminase